MANLSYPSATEVQLRLEAQENAILAVVRGCPWWTKAEIEGHVPGHAIVSAVTLTTGRGLDSTLRRILQMSFGLVFPQEGGDGLQPPQKAQGQPSRGSRLSRSGGPNRKRGNT